MAAASAHVSHVMVDRPPTGEAGCIVVHAHGQGVLYLHSSAAMRSWPMNRNVSTVDKTAPTFTMGDHDSHDQLQAGGGGKEEGKIRGSKRTSPSRRHGSPSKNMEWDLGEPPAGSSLTRAVTPAPSQTPSVGLLECESNKGADMFLKEMNTFLREMQHMTPTQRFEMTQKALLDMQSVLNVHMAMRDKSDRNAAEHRKACIEAEAECSRMRFEMAKMEKSLNLREQNLLKERATNKKLTAELEAKTQEAFDHAQEAHALARNLKRREDECAEKAELIAKLESKNSDLTKELHKSQAHVDRLEKQIASEQRQHVETEKKLKSTERDLLGTRAMEQAAWEATQKTRMSIIDGIDEALLMNPNHFNEVDMMAHRDRSVTVAGSKVVI